MDNKTRIIMCPTYRQAVYEWEKFLRVFPNAWTNVKRNHLSMTNVITGTTYIFHAETEGQRELLGFHGDVVSIDEFELEEEDENSYERRV